MGIMTRLVRMCKADIHGALDHLEDKGLILKQSLREMEEELDRNEAALGRMSHNLEKARLDLETRSRECEKLEQDVNSALKKDRDDLAKGLLKRLTPLTGHRDELARHVHALERDYDQYQEHFRERHRQYRQMQLRSEEYFRSLEKERWSGSTRHTTYSGEDDRIEMELELELLQRKEALKAAQGGDRP